ncbi:MAG: nuclear transport factor 2 family protein [Bacteroidetes bacterium]|nr:nuclear transport factor 2 family protein [Bacteroidota bacterium]
MRPTHFIAAYTAALASQTWQQVAPFIADEAVVTISTGSVYRGIAAIQQAYQRNFELIQSEEYSMRDIHWLHQGDDIAVYTFSFSWQGIINGELANGSGQGSAVIKRYNDTWKLLAEQLGK